MSSAVTAARPFEGDAKSVMESEMELNRAIEDLRGMAALDTGRAVPARSGSALGTSVTMQIPVEVNIVLGSAEMSVAELAGLQTGSTIQLDRRVGEPVDVVVNGVKIARGEIMLLENEPTRFGFRITDIHS